MTPTEGPSGLTEMMWLGWRLFWLIRRAIDKDQQMELEKFQNKIVSMLTAQGFDERECDVVFDDLVAKYRTGAHRSVGKST